MKGIPPFGSGFSKTKMALLLVIMLIAASVILLPLGLNKNQVALSQQLQGAPKNMTTSSSSSALTSQQHQLLSNGTSFEIGNVTFSHNTLTVGNGTVQLHYVIGGHGNPVVLLHGWPETWYEWRHVMPALAKNYTVIAPDMPGLGDSSRSPTGYDGKTIAEDIHQLVNHLGFSTILLVGHDIGVPVAYAYAAARPVEVKKLVLMDSVIPGFAVPGRTTPWWFAFHQVSDLPEALTQGKELLYLSWFYHNFAYNPSAITPADMNEYVSHYSTPGGMQAGFGYYRAFPQDAIQNLNYSKTKLPMPALAIGAGFNPVFGGNVTMPSIVYSLQQVASNAQGIIVPNSGHWIAEEQPVFLINELSKFFGNSTSTG